MSKSLYVSHLQRSIIIYKTKTPVPYWKTQLYTKGPSIRYYSAFYATLANFPVQGYIYKFPQVTLYKASQVVFYKVYHVEYFNVLLVNFPEIIFNYL